MSTVMKPSAVAAAHKVSQIAGGYIASSALNALIRLGIADLLAEKPLTVKELAERTGTKEDALYRALCLISGMGIFEELPNKTFTNNEESNSIRKNLPDTQHDMVAFISDPFHFKAYTDMLPVLRDGRTASEHVWGKPIFEVFAADNAEQVLFDNAMTSSSKGSIPNILKHYDFSGIETLVDVAGGHGALITAILAKSPNVKGILFDLPHVVHGAKARIQEMGLEGRCEMVEGDFFKSVPNGDAIVMKHIIHDWDDEQAIAILKNCHKAMPAHGKVILLEMILSGPNQADFSKIMDIEMLMLPGGRERTEEQYATLFSKAGFKLKGVTSTGAPTSVIEAVKA